MLHWVSLFTSHFLCTVMVVELPPPGMKYHSACRAFTYFVRFWKRVGIVVEPRTPEREVGGSIPISAVLCP